MNIYYMYARMYVCNEYICVYYVNINAMRACMYVRINDMYVCMYVCMYVSIYTIYSDDWWLWHIEVDNVGY